MIKIIIILILGAAIGAGVPLIKRHWGFNPPGQKEIPRPNIKRTKFNNLVLPVGAALIVGVFLWIGFGLLFSSNEPSGGNPVKNTVSAPVTPDSQDTQAPAAPADDAADRKTLVADSPIVKSALRVAPVASSLDQVGKQAAGSSPGGSTTTIPPAAPPEPAPDTATARTKPETTPAAKPETKPETKPESTGGSGVLFTVHLASFEEKANADRAQAQLKKAGVDAFVSHVDLNGKTWHRLMAGRFSSKTKAEQYGQELKKRGLTKGLGDYQVKPIGSE